MRTESHQRQQTCCCNLSFIMLENWLKLQIPPIPEFLQTISNLLILWIIMRPTSASYQTTRHTRDLYETEMQTRAPSKTCLVSEGILCYHGYPTQSSYFPRYMVHIQCSFCHAKHILLALHFKSKSHSQWKDSVLAQHQSRAFLSRAKHFSLSTWHHATPKQNRKEWP